MHFGPIEFSLPYVPNFLPFPTFWVYFVGICLLAFTFSAILKKLDGLAAFLLAILLLIFVLTVHFPTALTGDFKGVMSIFRDTCQAGGALLYGAFIAKDLRFSPFGA